MVHITGGRAYVLAVVMTAGTAVAQPDAGTAGGEVVRYDGQKVVRVQVQSVRDFRTAIALTDDVWTHEARIGLPLDIRVTPEQYQALLESGLKHDVLIADLQAAVDGESAEVNARRLMDNPAFYDNFRTYDEIKTYCQGLAAAHPGLAEYIVLGNSHEGREIFGLRITGTGGPANKPGAMFFACQHAREWATPPTAVWLAEMLLKEYSTKPQVQHLMDNVEFFIVPIVNADGYVYTWTNQRLWRKNRRPVGSGCVGVDLNRNWGYQWGGVGASTNPCSDTYRGTAAFSEPETQVLRDFALARPNIQASLDIHSYGQLVMSPWGYTSALPPDHATFMTVNKAMSDAIQSVHGRVYTYGPIYTELYPASGFSVDWFYGAKNAWGFITEVRSDGGGFILPVASIVPNAEENYAAELALASHIAPAFCYANCDGSTGAPALNVADFGCFLTRFAQGNGYANCDGSTGEPMLNVADFGCFLTKFAAGCP